MNRFRLIHVGLELDRKEDVVTLGSRQAARQAVWLARRTGASVRFFHSTWDDREGEGGELSKEHGATLEDLVHDHAEELGRECELAISEERAWLHASRCIREPEQELVVVGKRDRDRDEGRRIGSVAIKLLRKCPCTVWVVKPEHDLVHKLILAATDLSAVGRDVLQFSEWIREQSPDCQLHVVHALRLPASIRNAKPALPEEEYSRVLEDLRAEALSAVQECLTGSHDEPELKVHIGRGAPAQVVREAVQHLGPDLLVMGTLSKGGVAGMMVGSTAERLLQRVDCSILGIKPDDFISPIPR